jgi:hypothetical protein
MGAAGMSCLIDERFGPRGVVRISPTPFWERIRASIIATRPDEFHDESLKPHLRENPRQHRAMRHCPGAKGEATDEKNFGLSSLTQVDAVMCDR